MLKNVYLKRHCFYSMITIGEDELSRFKTNLKQEDWLRDHVSSSLFARMTAYLWGTKPEVVKVEYPETWWDGFKQKHLPTFSKWVNRPPRIKQVVVRKFAVYPMIPCRDRGQEICIPILEKEEFIQ